MTKIQLTFDSETKVMEATIDGQPIAGFCRLSGETYVSYDGEPMGCIMVCSMEETENDVKMSKNMYWTWENKHAAAEYRETKDRVASKAVQAILATNKRQ